MANKSSGVRVVSQLAIDMRNAIIELAGDRAVFDSRERWIARAARVAGVSYRTARAFFYAEHDEPRSSSVEKVRMALARKRKEQTDAEAVSRNEYREIMDRISILEARLNATDPEFYGEETSRLREMARGAGGVRGAVDR